MIHMYGGLRGSGSPKSNRDRGMRFELRVAKMIESHLGYVMERNLDQYRRAGGDLLAKRPQGEAHPMDRFSFECKATVNAPQLTPWWRQTLENAVDRIPVLVYQVNREPIVWCFSANHLSVFGPFDVPMKRTYLPRLDADITRVDTRMAMSAFKSWLTPDAEP